MRIAILGCGSLVWDPRGLPLKGRWQRGGPALPIEFSRVSSDGRLTLVIDPDNGVDVPTRFVLSQRSDLDDAICDLRTREGTVAKYIGYVCPKRRTKQRCAVHSVAARIRIWATANGFDAVVWTDLRPNFEEETGVVFTLDRAEEYLRKLPRGLKRRAQEYLRKAPKEVDTPLRRRLRAIGWLHAKHRLR